MGEHKDSIDERIKRLLPQDVEEEDSDLIPIIREEYRLLLWGYELALTKDLIKGDEKDEIAHVAIQNVLTRRKSRIAVNSSMGIYFERYGFSLREPETDRENKVDILLVEKGSRNPLPAFEQGITIIEYELEDMEPPRLINFLHELDEILTKKRDHRRRMVARQDDLGKEILLVDPHEERRGEMQKILQSKGFNVYAVREMSEGVAHYSSGVPYIDLRMHTHLEVKKVMEAISSCKNELETREIIRSIILPRWATSILEAPVIARHIVQQRAAQHDQFAMRQYCLVEGSIDATLERLSSVRKLDGTPYTKEDIIELASRNQLQAYLDMGGADIYSTLRKRSDDALREFFRAKMAPVDFVTDEALLEILVQRATGVSADAGSPIISISESTLGRIRGSIDRQMGVDEKNRPEVHVKVAEYLLLRPEERNPESDADLYFGRVFLEEIAADVGADEIMEIRRDIGSRLKKVMELYESEEEKGIDLLASDFRIPSPSQNPVFRIDSKFIGGVTVSGVAKVYDKRRDRRGNPLSESSRKAKDDEHKQEMSVADYYTRCGLNRGVNFFYESRNEVNFAIMRYWGRKNLMEAIYELRRRAERETIPQLKKRQTGMINQLFERLVRKIAKVQAFTPLNLAHEEKEMRRRLVEEGLGLYNSDNVPPEHKRKDLMYLFEKKAPEHLRAEYFAAAAVVRDNIDSLLEFNSIHPGLQIVTGFKDVSTHNWFISMGDVEGSDWAALRKLPSQYDLSTVMILGAILDNEEQIRFARMIFGHLNREIRDYNRWVSTKLGDYKGTLTEQLGKPELCRKAGRDHLGEFAKHVVGNTRFENTLTKKGRINQSAINEFDKVVSDFAERLRKGDAPSEAVEQINDYANNIRNFLLSLEHKQGFYDEDTTPEEERTVQFNCYWEGLLGVMPYRTFMINKSFVGFYFDEDADAKRSYATCAGKSYLGLMASMTRRGAADSIGELGRICEKNAIPGNKIYSGERIAKFKVLEEGFRKIAECISQLDQYLSKPS